MSEKHRKEIESLLNKSESGVNKRLQKLYKELAEETTQDIIKLAKEIEETDKFSKKLQKERLETIRSQMYAKANQLEGTQKENIYDFLRHDGQVAFNELFYDFEMTEKIPLSFTMLTDKQINVIINTPVANRKLSTRLKGNSTKMKQNLNRVLTRGFAKGLSTQKMAVQIAEIGGANYRRAMNIARTESGRVTSVARQQSQNHAKSIGLKLEKQWISTLDKLTRSNHQILDGKRIDIDAHFEIAGYKALQPHMFGVAAEDCNCRCRTITIVNGMGPELRRDNESKEVIEYQNYDEWLNGKKKAISKKEVNKDNPFEKDIKAIYKNADNDRLKFASDYLKYSDIDLPVEIENAKARGFNQIDNLGKGEPCSVKRFVLQKNDNRGIDYQIKTALHEGYHARINGLSTNIFYQQSDFDNWLSIEETMTELSAHYQFSLFNDRVLMPAYPNYIALNLPRLKKLPEFKGATSFTDFGKKAMEYRLNPDKITADWTDIYERMEAVDLDFMEYMKDNYVEDMIVEKETILDMIIENNPKFGQFRDNIATDIDDWVIKLKTDDEHHANPSAFTQMVAALYRLKGVR